MTDHKKQYKLEVLAPAGSFETFLAVINAGADAVYLGGSRFGARAYADNFDADALLRAIDYAHLHDRKVYLTVNTLLKERELAELADYLLPFYRQGLDAVIVQDMGAFELVREQFPDLAVHTSTQMTITGAEGAEYMHKLGASRVVLARELSFAEISYIHSSVSVQLEAFVHGALCYCYSGQCLFSSMLGGRSGNRGRCAQPCRLPYELCDSHKKKLPQRGSYMLSPKDLCSISYLPDLFESGVYSLKIEGRMKQAEYAAGVVSIYRAYVDAYLEDVARYGIADARRRFLVSGEDMQKLWDFGNRSGFTEGYFYRQNGKDMITFEKPGHIKSNEALQNEIRRTYIDDELKEKIKGNLILKKELPAIIELSCKGKRVSVEGDIVQAAQNQPLSLDKVERNLRKTGNTPFVFDELTVEMEDDVFLPVGAINRLRRDAMEQLMGQVTGEYHREVPGTIPNGQTAKNESFHANSTKHAGNPAIQAKENSFHLSVSVEWRGQLGAVLRVPFVENVYLDSGCYRQEEIKELLSEDVSAIHQAGKRAYYILPPVFRKRTAGFYAGLCAWLTSIYLDGIVVGSYDSLGFALTHLSAMPFILDHRLYLFNNRAKAGFGSQHPLRDTAPLELNRGELMARDNRGTELVLYGYLPLMLSAQCVHANNDVCDKQPGLSYLKDRYGKYFPVKNHCQDCYNTLYNSTPLLLFDCRKDVLDMGIVYGRLSFTIESEKETRRILDLYKASFLTGTCTVKTVYQGEYTNGHYKRGVE